MKKIVLLQATHGPYHIARLEAFVKLCQNLSWNITSMELSRQSLVYDWVNDITGKEFIISLLEDKAPEQVNFLSLCYKLWNLLRKIKPDVLVIAGYGKKIFTLALWWCKLNNIPVVLMSESKQDDASRNFFIEKIKSLIIRQFDSALVGGKPHQQYLIKLGFPENAIFSGYDVVGNDEFSPDKIKIFAKPLEKPFFFAINRFIKKKNLPLLISAYAIYQQKTENPWHLVLCGDGELRPELENLINKYNLQKFVHLPGFLQINELLPYFAHAQCFIHASTTEQWGLVVNEAMAAGLPVIISKRCGCYEDLIIEGVNGFGFNPENQEELTNLMMKINSDEIDLKKMGGESLKQIQKYSPEFHGNQLIKAINHSCNQ